MGVQDDRGWSWRSGPGRTGLILLLVATALAVGSLTVGATASTSQPSGTQVRHLVATSDRFRIIRGGEPGAETIQRFELTEPGTGAEVGRAYLDCTDLWDEQGQCHWDLALSTGDSWSQITLVGLVSLVDDVHVVPIVGGTGAYRFVSGEASWKFGKSAKKASVTLTMKGVVS